MKSMIIKLSSLAVVLASISLLSGSHFALTQSSSEPLTKGTTLSQSPSEPLANGTILNQSSSAEPLTNGTIDNVSIQHNPKSTSEIQTEKWPAIKKDIYSGWLCGLVEAEGGSDAIVINPDTSEVKLIDHLSGVSSSQACAISPDGDKIAFSNYITQIGSEGMYLSIKKLSSGDTIDYFKISDCNQLISDISWLSDNITLLLKLSIKEGVFYSDMLCTLNTETNSLVALDQGYFSYGNKNLDEDKDMVYYGLSQKAFDALITKYGGKKSIPVDENSKWNYVDISNPMLSPDCTKVLYNVSFNRNATPAYDEKDINKPHLWLASGIWIADISGKEPPYLVFGNDDPQCNIGKTIWTDNPNIIILNRYFDELSNGSSNLESFNLTTKEISKMILRDDQFDTNIPRYSYDGKAIIMSDGSEGAKIIEIDIETLEKSEIKYEYKGTGFNIWRFNPII